MTALTPSGALESIERDIRTAIWNAGMNGGMGQDLTLAFIRRAMAEPCMARVLAALDVRATPAEGWQDIATAPKDGTQIDLWVTAPGARDGGVRVCDAAWLSGKWRAIADHDEHDYEPFEGFEWFANFGPSVPVETDICRAAYWMKVAPPTPDADHAGGEG